MKAAASALPSIGFAARWCLGWADRGHAAALCRGADLTVEPMRNGRKAGPFQDLGQVGAGPAEAAFRRSHRDADAQGHIPVGISRNPDQRDDIAVLGRKLAKGAQEFRHGDPPVMVGQGDQGGGMVAIAVLHVMLALAQAGIKGVAQDGEQPSAQVAARLKAVKGGIGLDHRVLHQIFGGVKVV